LQILFKGYDVEIILVLRYQVDWLISTYRESVHEHHYQSIEAFLNIEDGSFLEPIDDSTYVNCNALSLDFFNIINNYQKIFGKDNTHVLYFEEFKKDKKQFIGKFENILGKKLDIKEYKSEIINRGYSASGIAICLKVVGILKRLKLTFLIPKPIFFFGKKSIYVKDDYNIYSTNLKSFLKENNPLKLPFWFLYKVIYKLFGRGKMFRYVIKKVIDKIQYSNSDLLAPEYVSKLNTYYHQENIKIESELLKSKLPENYTKDKK